MGNDCPRPNYIHAGAYVYERVLHNRSNEAYPHTTNYRAFRNLLR